MRTVAIPSGVKRLVSTTSRFSSRGEVLLPCHDYPSNSCCFVHLDARFLLPYWHMLFDASLVKTWITRSKTDAAPA